MSQKQIENPATENTAKTQTKAEEKLTAAVIQALHDSKRDEFVKRLYVFSGMAEKVKTAQEKMKESYPEQGVYLYVLKCEWIAARESQDGKLPKIAGNVTFPEYHEKVVGKGRKPNRHGESCAHTFAVTVAKELMSEEDYWDNSSEALQRASAVFTAVKDDMDHPASKEAIALLKRRPKDILKKLRSLRDRIVEVVENEGTDDEKTSIKFLTEEELAQKENGVSVLDAHVQIDALLKAGHLGAVIAALTTLAKETADEETAKSLTQGLAVIPSCLRANVDADGKRRWSDAALKAWLKGEKKPENAPAPEKPAIDVPAELVNA